MKPQKKQETKVEKVIIPEDLLCTLCSDLLTDAIMMPCCGTSFCDECKLHFLFQQSQLISFTIYLFKHLLFINPRYSKCSFRI